jgi:hypothetical protein
LTKKQNRHRYQTVHAANLAIVILLFLVLGCSCQKLGEMINRSAESGRNTPSNSAPPPSRKETPTGEYDLTFAKYEQIKIGMPRSDVEDILGGNGTEISSSSGGGMTFTVVKWEGDDFKSVILTFRNDKVMTKSQVGLK